MRPVKICKEVTIHARAAQVWPWIGSEAGLRQWWQVEVWFEPKQGGRCAERGVRNGQRYQFEGVVAVYHPPHQLVLLLNSKPSDLGEATAMSIAITLEEVAEQTHVRVVHQIYVLEPSDGAGRPTAFPIAPAVAKLPVILNQLPAGPVRTPGETESEPHRFVASVNTAQLDPAWITEQEARWSVRLAKLFALTGANTEKQ